MDPKYHGILDCSVWLASRSGRLTAGKEAYNTERKAGSMDSNKNFLKSLPAIELPDIPSTGSHFSD
jgi:hypothetical protein